MTCPKCIDYVVSIWPAKPAPCQYCDKPNRWLAQFEAREADFAQRKAGIVVVRPKLTRKPAKPRVSLADQLRGKTPAEIGKFLTLRIKARDKRREEKAAKQLAKVQTAKADLAKLQAGQVAHKRAELQKRAITQAIAELRTAGVIPPKEDASWQWIRRQQRRLKRLRAKQAKREKLVNDAKQADIDELQRRMKRLRDKLE